MTTHPAQPTQDVVEHLITQADPPPPVKGGLNRLLVWIFPANFFIFAMWGAIPGVLLTAQVQAIDPKLTVQHMMIVSVIGAVCAMIAQPIAGQVSDRTRSRLGRRAPWMIGGVVVGAVGLVALAFASGSLVVITIAWCIVQIGYNFVQGPVSAILPDRVPLNRRGTFSAIFGFALMGGSTVGGIFAAVFIHMIPVAYIAFAIVVGVVILLFVLFNPDHSNKGEPRPSFDLRAFLHTFWVSPIKHPDFFWAFTGRLLLYIGYFAISGYQLLILENYVHLSETEAAGLIALAGVIILVCILLTTAISGPLSDRFGRRKPFVFASSVLMAVAMIIPFFAPTVAGWIAYTIVMGLGFGMFQSVDTALMSQVLPSSESFGKDLGVVNIAATLPQVLAPFIAGAIVLIGGYQLMFPVGFGVAILGAVCVWFIKSSR
ncbi:MFS transporter [Curtobacterium pusillum]|uniref:MFS family permease n=1 Tax=Curtobacterium pusillum TaxID=69373 RepID=A0AAW3T9K3_9MICO|nr:MFS transporter [Curtobacterium pusillum]MBA8992021.1 MFS family permease [Curtobacterium pusillum]NUU12657.1 MFS transporter [Curtobacterium pusillum]GLK33078.1 MFS transporter [Curtobacterium pusillum]